MQELSAIQMNCETRQIVDVYHGHANVVEIETDSWSRHHIHGLNPLFLYTHGFPSEDSLLQNFRSWLRGKDVLAMYGNNPSQEKFVLNLNILDMCLPQWIDRVDQAYHKVAFAFKKEFVPILDKRCCKEAHNNFTGYPLSRGTSTEFAKRSHGVHCSLYDTFELYLCYVSN